MENLVIKDGIAEMDFDRVRDMLAESFWAPGISRAEVVQGAENSALVVGAFLEGRQIGFARVISDKTRFAYILDAYVAAAHRRKGVGRKMMRHILAHRELQDVYQWLLRTKDAHGVYSALGFTPVSRPLDWLEICNARPDR
jgi:GNAT superfamily N-acetyltransferase